MGRLDQRHHSLTENIREVTSSAVEYRLVIKNSGDPLSPLTPLAPPPASFSLLLLSINSRLHQSTPFITYPIPTQKVDNTLATSVELQCPWVAMTI
ncbi:hypothetical protein EVAR_45754_1 [Eumeta japonica]|uniref:Uncharacterized protein n=1 Tax=Eumeta variegata TaxID=151549 RepID=A0A4C1YSK4_EUMVA|nr:hypothetical protein EVAR_45754_1 [Eumeta japonica]